MRAGIRQVRVGGRCFINLVSMQRMHPAWLGAVSIGWVGDGHPSVQHKGEPVWKSHCVHLAGLNGEGGDAAFKLNTWGTK